jgi:hypothetical protein
LLENVARLDRCIALSARTACLSRILLLDYGFLIYSFMFSSLFGDRTPPDRVGYVWSECRWQFI